MKPLVIALALAGCALSFGVPGVPDVPDVPEVEVPDIRIPGMELLDQLQVKLDGLLGETDGLRELIPDLAVLDDLSLKLSELRDTDPEAARLQEELDGLRGELVSARARIQEVSDEIRAEVGAMKSTVDQFTEGLPIN